MSILRHAKRTGIEIEGASRQTSYLEPGTAQCLRVRNSEENRLETIPREEITAFESAQRIWQREPCRDSFEVCLALHLLYGYVFAQPGLFIMGRPVKHDAPYEQITDPAWHFMEPDAWFVYCAAGAAGAVSFLALEPYPLPYFGWERRNGLRFYTREQIIRYVFKTSQSTCAEAAVQSAISRHEC